MQSCLDIVEFLTDEKALDLSRFMIVYCRCKKIKNLSPFFLFALVNSVDYDERFGHSLQNSTKEFDTVLWRCQSYLGAFQTFVIEIR